jgi:tyrosine-protein kinase Etk/Wzc
MSTLSSDTQTDSDEIGLLELLQVIVENLRLLVIGPLVIGLIALGIMFLIRPTFTATTVFMPPQQQQSSTAMLLQSLGALGGLAGAATGLKNPNDQFVALLKSRYVEDKLIERFRLRDRYDEEYLEDTRKELENNVRINSGKDGLIKLEVDDSDPKLAAQIANAHVEELGKLMNRLALSEAQQRRLFFEAQLVGTKEKLTRAEQALRASGVNSSALKSNPEVAVEAVARMQAEVAAQEVKLSTMRSYLADSAPAMRQAFMELAALRAQLTKQERASEAPSAGDSDYVSRFRDFKYYETLFELFAKQFELAKVDEAKEGTAIQVIDIAQPPEKKSKPKKGLLTILITLGALMFLLVFVFIRNNFRKLTSSSANTRQLEAIRHPIGRSVKHD